MKPGLTSLVSVIVPVYNQEKFLQDCLQSLIRQTMTSWEVVVVDDASPAGNVGQIVDLFHDTRIHVVRHSLNQGVSAARNTGFRNSSASYVVAVDADDMLAENYLEKALNVLEKNPQADCVFGDLMFFGTEDRISRRLIHDHSELTQKQWIPGAGVLMRRIFWEHVGGYCEAKELRYGNEDWDFWITAASLGFHAVHLPELLYFYRRHESSMSPRLGYYNFITREFMFKRNRKYFIKFGKGKLFRADGFTISAKAAYARGHYFRAALLSLRGFCLDIRRRHLIKILIRSLGLGILFLPFAILHKKIKIPL